jgi:hypothetical protein
MATSAPTSSLDGVFISILLGLVAVTVGLVLVSKYFAAGGSPALPAVSKAAATFSPWIPVR